MYLLKIVSEILVTQLGSNSTAFIQLAKGLTKMAALRATVLSPPALIPENHGMENKANSLETLQSQDLRQIASPL